MSATVTPSSPTKSSLTSWWKQFKQKQPAAASTSLAPPTRPILPHQSRSSGAISTAAGATGKTSTSSSGADHNVLNIPADVKESPIFGVELQRSIQYANVSISLSDPSGEQFVYGYIPIVVAKCGVYLKKNATNVEGIFRLSGSARRIKELQLIFNSPPRFGKGLDWTGFNVHDAANVLRRYLNNLPEPIIPLQFYEQFRDPLREHHRIVEYLEMHSALNATSASATEPSTSIPAIVTTSANSPPHSDADDSQKTLSDSSSEAASTAKPTVDKQLLDEINQAVNRYQQLILTLPSLNRQLLMYILDLLSIFAAKSEENLMPAANLAAIFQPSLLSHPQHDMAPGEYHLSRVAIEFLVQHSNKFLWYIESIAIKEHEQQKAARKKESENLASINESPYINGSSPSKERQKLSGTSGHPKEPPRRKHSKSLSSVTGVPPPVSDAITTGPSDSLKVKKRPVGGSASQPQRSAKEPINSKTNEMTTNTNDVEHAEQNQNHHHHHHLPGHHDTGENNSGFAPVQRFNSRDSNSSGSGLFSSIKRNVSFSRRPSQKGRTPSESSISSNERTRTYPRVPSAGSVSQSSGLNQSANVSDRVPVAVPVITASTEETHHDEPPSESGPTSSSDDQHGHRRGLSSLFSKRSKSPPIPGRLDVGRGGSTSSSGSRTEAPAGHEGGELNTPRYLGRDKHDAGSSLTIDQALASPTSSSLSATSSDNLNAPSPRFLSLNSVFGAAHNDSNTSLAKTISGASSVGEDDENGIPVQSRPRPRPVSNGSESSPHRISRWRRSIMAFASSGDERSASQNDLMAPPTLQGAEGLSPSSSNGSGLFSHSPSRNSWLRRLSNRSPSRERSMPPEASEAARRRDLDD